MSRLIAVAAILILPSSLHAQLTADSLKTTLTTDFSRCIQAYNDFQTTPSRENLLKGTKFASMALSIALVLERHYANTFSPKDFETLISISDGLSGTIPLRFIDEPTRVRNDPGFVTFLRIARIQLEGVLGKLSKED